MTGLESCEFTPDSSRFAGKKLQGINIKLIDREKLDAPALGVEIAAALISKYKNDFDPSEMICLLGNRETFKAILAGRDPKEIANGWTEELLRWQKKREIYFLYK